MKVCSQERLGCSKSSQSIFSKESIDKLIFSLLYTISFVLSLISFFWSADRLIKINVIISIFIFVLLYKKNNREDIPVYIYMGFLVISFLISSLYVGRTGWRFFTPILFIVSSFSVAVILLRGYISSWAGYVLFYLLAAYFYILMLGGVDPYSAFKYCSCNGISMVMLIVCISLYVIVSMENKRIDLKPALFTLIISIWGVGRSGIVSSIVLVLGLLFVTLRAKSVYFYNLIVDFIVAGFLFILYLLVNRAHFTEHNAIAHVVARQAEGTSERWKMWMNYYNNLDMPRILFGVNVVKDPWSEGEIFAYNYHNSFINLHLQTGFMALITLAIISFALIKFCKTQQVFFVLFLVLILRSSTDILFFFGRFDFIVFFFIFYFLSNMNFRASNVQHWTN